MKSRIVFKGDYSSLPKGKIIKGGLREQSFGKWEQTSHHYSWKSKRLPSYNTSALPWRRVDFDGRTLLEQPEKWDNVVICAGDADWTDITFKGGFIPLSRSRCGILFRYNSSRSYYFAALEDGRRASLYKRIDDDLLLVDSVRFPYKTRRECSFEANLAGDNITVAFNKIPVFNVVDSDFRNGKIGFRSDGPLRCCPVKVSMKEPELAAFNILKEKKKRLLKDKRAVVPKPVKIAEIPVNVEADYIHLDDFNNDGNIEAVVIKRHCTGPNRTRIAYMGMLDIEGNLLWSNGAPKENEYPLHSDIAFNFGDVDGDGRKEILVTQDLMLKIFDAQTGELKNEMPTPGIKGEKHIIGDSILLADLEGKGSRQNILLKDRYCNIWAYDNKLNLLWHRTLNTGHYPRAADINGDGREEVMAGYSMLSADGETMWTVPGADPMRNVWSEPPHSEHADSVWIGRFKEGKDIPVQVAIAASDMGLLILDANSGELVRQEKCGHAQSLAIAKFRKGLPGYQFAVCNLWGNPGIYTIFDCEGRRLVSKEMPPFSIIIPVNWKGDGEAFLMAPQTKTLFDGSLDPVLEIKKKNKEAKGSVRPLAGDFLGLGIDQLVFFEGNKINVYKPETHGSVKMKHDVDNFNFYGAFFLEH